MLEDNSSFSNNVDDLAILTSPSSVTKESSSLEEGSLEQDSEEEGSLEQDSQEEGSLEQVSLVNIEEKRSSKVIKNKFLILS